MSITLLQQQIRRRKTPLALGLAPEVSRIPQRIVQKFVELYGDCPMAQAEALRYHGCALLDAAAEQLPAVVLDAASYIRYGAVGMDVLCNLISAAKAHGLYTVADCRGALAEPWLAALPQADAVTVLPYLGADACAAEEDKAVFAVAVTSNPSAGDVQNLLSGDRRLYAAAAEQMARHGAGIVLESGYSLDIRDMRRRLDKTFFLLTHCGAEDAVYAFDDYGHGALAVDGALQYAQEPAAAMEETVRAWKKWVTVV